jgi:hypothetical protein
MIENVIILMVQKGELGVPAFLRGSNDFKLCQFR